MRIYIAGPMTGRPQLNFPAFHDAAAFVRSRGHEAVNPAEINADPTMGWEACMRRDIPQLCTCNAILMLPGYEFSRGAQLEMHIATALGMQVLLARAEVPQPVAPSPTADDDWLPAQSHTAAACRIDDPTCESCQ